MLRAIRSASAFRREQTSSLVLEISVMRGNGCFQSLKPLRLLWIVWGPIHDLLDEIALLVCIAGRAGFNKIRRADAEATSL